MSVAGERTFPTSLTLSAKSSYSFGTDSRTVNILVEGVNVGTCTLGSRTGSNNNYTYTLSGLTVNDTVDVTSWNGNTQITFQFTYRNQTYTSGSVTLTQVLAGSATITFTSN